MIRARTMRGLPVVDLEAATKLGDVDEVLLDPEACQIAGFCVSLGRTLFGAGPDVIVPASAVHAIGPDALTVRRVEGDAVDQLGALPRLGALIGRKLVTHGGKVLGAVEDVLVDETTGRIIGYAIGEGAGRRLESLFFSGPRAAHPDYVRADAALRFGGDLIVAPDSAVVRGEPTNASLLAEAGSTPPPASSLASQQPVTSSGGLRWAEPAPVSAAPRANPSTEPSNAAFESTAPTGTRRRPVIVGSTPLGEPLVVEPTPMEGDAAAIERTQRIVDPSRPLRTRQVDPQG